MHRESLLYTLGPCFVHTTSLRKRGQEALSFSHVTRKINRASVGNSKQFRRPISNPTDLSIGTIIHKLEVSWRPLGYKNQAQLGTTLPGRKSFWAILIILVSSDTPSLPRGQDPLSIWEKILKRVVSFQLFHWWKSATAYGAPISEYHLVTIGVLHTIKTMKDVSLSLGTALSARVQQPSPPNWDST